MGDESLFTAIEEALFAASMKAVLPDWMKDGSEVVVSAVGKYTGRRRNLLATARSDEEDKDAEEASSSSRAAVDVSPDFSRPRQLAKQTVTARAAPRL